VGALALAIAHLTLPGTLYLVATPIGHLGDITLRALDVLRRADLVLAEDTRRTALLLRHYGIATPLRSLYAQNEEARLPEVLARLERGESLALVADAGTPLVSDPGARLVRAALEAGHAVVPVPGPSAVLAALVVSGLPADRFLFLGFPPRRGAARARWLRQAAQSPVPVVMFEAPGRVVELLEALVATAGSERFAVLARELTKLHEEVRRGPVAELAAQAREEPPRGEVVVVLAGAPEDPAPEVEITDAPAAVEDFARALLAAGRRPSEAARELARRLAWPRRAAYELVRRVHEKHANDDTT